ncbi:MAG: hypothetical protein VX293_10650 [Candidatus Latescibacterota bacterium]|nr:hypothetical protein [Candidatus Latescibacterota bacterium]
MRDLHWGLDHSRQAEQWDFHREFAQTFASPRSGPPVVHRYAR